MYEVVVESVRPVSRLFVEVPTGGILSRIDLLIVEELHKSIEAGSYTCSKKRTDPVDPMVSRELRRGNSRT